MFECLTLQRMYHLCGLWQCFHYPTLSPAGFNRQPVTLLTPSCPYTLSLNASTSTSTAHTHTHTNMQTSCCSAGWQSAPVPAVRTEQLPSLCPRRLSVPAAAEPGLWSIWQNEGNTGEMLKTRLALTVHLHANLDCVYPVRVPDLQVFFPLSNPCMIIWYHTGVMEKRTFEQQVEKLAFRLHRKRIWLLSPL